MIVPPRYGIYDPEGDLGVLKITSFMPSGQNGGYDDVMGSFWQCVIWLLIELKDTKSLLIGYQKQWWWN
jgi:hypothetical protein